MTPDLTQQLRTPHDNELEKESHEEGGGGRGEGGSTEVDLVVLVIVAVLDDLLYLNYFISRAPFHLKHAQLR